MIKSIPATHFPYGEEAVEDEYFLSAKIRRVYEKLEDDISKNIFCNRLLYSLTYDYAYIRKILHETKAGISLLSDLENVDDLYVYGAGIRGARLAKIFPGKIKGYIDKYKTGLCEGYPIYGLEYIPNILDSTFLIANKKYSIEIKTYLLSIGVKKILDLKDYDDVASENRYFDTTCIKDVIDFSRSFVDIGCYDGEDTIRYLNLSKNPDSPVMAFEADPENYEVCKKNLKEFTSIRLFPFGIGMETSKKKFYREGNVNARFSEEGDIEIQVYPLDKFMNISDIGMIKIDVEGLEYDVLKGAKNIISKKKPIIAISVYHKCEDIWNLPNVILDLHPNYRFYLRHYSVGITDTVLYAIPINK